MQLNHFRQENYAIENDDKNISACDDGKYLHVKRLIVR